MSQQRAGVPVADGVILSLSKDPEQRGAAAHVEGSSILTNGAATNGAASANGATRAGDAALLTLDAAMVLVDEALAATGSRRACTRDEAQLAFEYVTNPIIGQAVWTDTSQSAIVIVSPQRASALVGFDSRAFQPSA